MSKSWATYGVDLHLDVGGPRVRAGLEHALREAVRAGRLRPGVRLPSSRDLAADLGIARNTVADAFGQLVAEGWLTARTGSGTYVSASQSERVGQAAALPLTDRPAKAPRPGARPALAAGAAPRYDLRPGVPALSAFPRRQWLAAARAALSAAGDQVLDYPDPRGLPELRASLAGYLARARGVTASPDRVVICGGFGHGLVLLCRVMADRGGGGSRAVIGIEEYGHLAYRRLARAQGMRTAALPVDERGAVPDRATRNMSAVLLTPAHQFPLGMTLAPRRRTDFVAWAADSGGLVIEDDYDGEFRFDRQPVGAMQALAPEQVVYAGTASKSLAPGLRLGWLVLPAAIIDAVVAAKENLGANNSVLDQVTMARLIDSGGYDRQIRQARLIYRRRRDALVAALRERVPGVRVTGIAAGQHALAELPGHVAEADVIERAARHGVAVQGLRSFAETSGRAAPAHGPALVIGYGRPADHAFSTAVGRLCAALAEVV
jgi:GntR family transcriptional regulator / MocR family aminotransferase